MVEIKQALKLISQGVYVVAVADGQQQNAFTAAWVMQVSFSPVMLAVSISPEHYSYKLLKRSGICSVNVLNKEQLDFAAHYGRSGVKDKMALGN